MLAIVTDRHLAEDLVAEAFARALAHWRKVSHHPAPAAWVVRTALNTRVSWWRARRREVSMTADDDWPWTPRAAYQNCPQLSDWAKKNGSTLLAQLAFASPGDFLRTTIPLVSQVYFGRSDFISHPVILPGLDWLVFPPNKLSLEVSALALALLIGAGFFISRTAAVLGIASMVSSAALLAISCSSLPRLGIQETLLIRVGLIILGAAAIDRLRRGRHERAQDVLSAQ